MMSTADDDDGDDGDDDDDYNCNDIQTQLTMVKLMMPDGKIYTSAVAS